MAAHFWQSSSVAILRRNRRLRFPALRGRSTGGPHSPVGRAEPQHFRAGEQVRQSGIYEVHHHDNHREPHEVVMLAEEFFPSCDTCNESVRFTLVRTAPYIFQDEDFAEQQ